MLFFKDNHSTCRPIRDVLENIVLRRAIAYGFNLSYIYLMRFSRFSQDVFKESVADLLYEALWGIHKSMRCIFSKHLERKKLKKNPLKNYQVMCRLNPYHKVMIKAAKEFESQRKKRKEAIIEARRKGEKVCVYLTLFHLQKCSGELS